MANYLPPIKMTEIFNIDGYIIYKEADHRYLRPIQKLQQKTTGITYNNTSETTNISKNINVANLVNTVEFATRNNGAFAEALAIGSNLVVGKNIVNSGDIFTNNIFAKSILIKDAVIENTILKNAKLDNVSISSRSLAFISTVSSDVQLQLDTNSKKVGPAGADSTVPGPAGADSTVPGPAGKDSTVPGPAGKDSTVPGPAGADSTVPGPAGKDSTVPGPADADSTVPGPAGKDSTVPGPAGKDSTVPGPKGADGLNSTLAGYFVNQGVGTFPIYGSMNDFSSFGLSLYIKGEKDSFIIMPFFALFVFSEINQGGKFLSMGNLSNNIEYYNISPLFRVKSCTLYKYNHDTQAYEVVNTVNNTNPEKTWN